jgi:hypothetical protein
MPNFNTRGATSSGFSSFDVQRPYKYIYSKDDMLSPLIYLDEKAWLVGNCTHRNQTISRKGANIISRRPSHGHLARRCCPQAFLRIFSEVTYIRTVGISSLLKIYTLPNHTITIGVCILDTQLLGLLYGGGASFVQKWSMPWISANI